MVFENGVKNIQAAAYNGARTVSTIKYPQYAYVIYERPLNWTTPEIQHRK